MSQLDAAKIVESFWADVLAACNPEAVDRYVVEDFTLTTGGVDIRSRDSFFPLCSRETAGSAARRIRVEGQLNRQRDIRTLLRSLAARSPRSATSIRSS